MSSTFFGLNISKTGLSGYEASINTTAHNISNAATKGYSRQIVDKQAEKAIRTNNSYGMQGAGVDIKGIERQRNNYYDVKYWNNSAHYGQYESKADFMAQIENYFNEVDTDGFTTEFNNFFNSLVDLTSEPDSSDKRVTAISYAGSLADYFNSLSENLTQVQTDANDQIKSICDRINSISDQVLSLNKQIQTIEVSGEKANDLRDQRDVLIDELSNYANVKVVESDVYVTGAKDYKGDPLKAGITDVAVYINDQLLVDSLSANHLVTTPREYKINESDQKGLYNVTWNTADGGEFDLGSSGMDGELKGLFDVRDGNNSECFKGSVTAAAGATEVTVQAQTPYGKSVNRLNIPDEGSIKIGRYSYDYSDFKYNYGSDGSIESYTFTLKEPVREAVTAADYVTATVGKDVDYKGIPYYQAQLNEFVRTFAQRFNALHNTGRDEHGDSGVDVFTARNKTTGDDMILSEEKDAEGKAALTGKSFSAGDDSYYRLTAGTISVNKDLSKDSNKFCTRYADNSKEKYNDGVATCELLKDLVDLKGDDTMFSQGAPADFLQSITADISVDTSKSKNFESSLSDVLKAISNQRTSFSGVDTNEELANMTIYVNGYNLCSKMISVFNEIYNKLINETGV